MISSCFFSLLLSGVDSDSEDDGLFGKEQKSSGLFIKPKLPPQTRENTKPSLSKAPDTLPSSGIFVLSFVFGSLPW